MAKQKNNKSPNRKPEGTKLLPDPDKFWKDHAKANKLLDEMHV